MLSQEKKTEIWEKLKNDKEFCKMLTSSDVQGLAVKCKEAGFEVTEGDIAELFVDAKELSDDELDAVSGGAGGADLLECVFQGRCGGGCQS